MLSRDRALNVSEPQLAGQASERLPEAADRVGLPGARSAEQLFRGLTVVLHPLDDRQAVMDFALQSALAPNPTPSPPPAPARRGVAAGSAANSRVEPR